MRVAIIVNPISGRRGSDPNAGRLRAEQARQLTVAAGVAAEVAVTLDRGHARDLARDFVARGFDRVVVWGGDGTINEAAGPLLRSPVMLGIVPAGSGDGIARSLGLPPGTADAMRAALGDTSGPLDVGRIGERHFLNIAGIGFDAAVAVVFNRRRRRGVRAYIADALRTVWSYRCEEYTLAFEGGEVSGRHFLIAFANGREYGNGIVLAPQADPGDGWLELVRVADGSPLRQLWRARRLAFRPLAPAEGVGRHRVRWATVSGPHLRGHVDGETFEASGDLTIRLETGGLRVAGAPARPTTAT
jgi:diacylglycerol kinase (ATP)